MDALLKALFSQFNSSIDPFQNASPEQLLQAEYGRIGGSSGTPYGLWGSMFGDVTPQSTFDNPLRSFAPDDPLLRALLSK